MKLNEVADPKARKQYLARLQQELQKQYAPRPKESPEAIAARNARADAFHALRKEADVIVEPIAKNTNDFAAFEKAAKAALTPEQLKTINLQWSFDFYNPARRQQAAQGWQAYADEKFPDHWRGD